MDVKVLEKSDSKIKFLVEGVKPSFAGALRRVMVAEIPTMAVEWVDFIKNDSAMSDELLANRIGQVPLTYDMKAYNLPGECKCEGKGCSRCQVKLAVKKKGPGIVYSDDLKSNDKSVKPAVEKIPLVELFENEELQFTAIAQLGLGKNHAKWQGAVVGYKNLPSIKISSIDKKDLEEFVNSCPRDVFKISGDRLTVVDPIKCNLCKQCVELSTKGEVEVSPVEDSFIFDVESVSGLTAEQIVLVSAKILGDKMKEFKKALKKVK
jgi:DNA-directed RNA polymerase subunit D